MSEKLSPGLYIVATPIGNLSDLSARASEILSCAELIAAEDTRITARLLSHIGTRRPLRVYNDHASEHDRQSLIAEMRDKAVALVSDAGTPLISDPGYKLVREARQAGVPITTIPGPCALIAALTLSGLPTDRFLFAGFLPPKAGARQSAIAELADIRATLLFYESGPRLADTLTALSETLGARDAAVVREISKIYEESVTAPLTDLAARYREAPPKGEIVIVVAPPAPKRPAGDDELDEVLREALSRLPVSRAAAEVSEQLGLPRKRVYDRALKLK